MTNRLALCVVAFTCCVFVRPGFADEPKPLTKAHAHNDYLHKRPLLDALEQNFCSVEADIFLVDDELLVGHTVLELRKDRTLESLYLEPLKKRVAENGGRVFKEGPVFTLLIDLKTDGEKTYAALNNALAKYEELLTVAAGQPKQGAVSVIISGNRPIETITADKTRRVGIDGRLTDLKSEASVDLLPLISDRWTAHFKWQGQGPFPDAEQAKLKSIIDTAHKSHRRVRFWATPDNTEMWRVLKAADVDLINTDDLPGLRKFLSEQ